MADNSFASEYDQEHQLILTPAEFAPPMILIKFVAFAVSSVPLPEDVVAAHSVENIGREPTYGVSNAVEWEAA